MKNDISKEIKILLAEDDPHLGKILKIYLESRGYIVVLALDGEKASELFRTNEDIRLVLLDIMMPKKDGFQLAKELKEYNPNIPIIFTTAKTMQEDILEGFKLGADDYITKPFSMEELIARINAVIQRTNHNISSPEKNIIIGKYIFDFQRQVLKFKEKEQKLTAREADVLKLLCNYSNQILDRRIALELIWGEDNYFHSRNMDVYISKIRKYLKNDNRIELRNIHGVGFKLIMPEEE